MSMQHFKLDFLFKYNQNKKNSKYKFYFSLNKTTKKKMEMFQKKFKYYILYKKIEAF